MTPRELRQLRGRLGMSQTEVARYLGLRHRSQVAHMESGRNPIDGSKRLLLERLAKMPGKPTLAAAGLDEPPPPGSEVRDLRQRLGLPAAAFAVLLGLRSGEVVAVEAGIEQLAGPALVLFRHLQEEHGSAAR